MAMSGDCSSHGGHDGAAVAVKAHLGAVIADASQMALRAICGDVDRSSRGDLAHDEHHAGRRRRLAGHAAPWGPARARRRVRCRRSWSQILSGCPSVTDSEVKILSVVHILISFRRGHKKAPCPSRQSADSYLSLIFRFASPDLAPCCAQVAGFHRAVPSTTLDKAVQLYPDYTKTAEKVKRKVFLSANSSVYPASNAPILQKNRMFTFAG